MVFFPASILISPAISNSSAQRNSITAAIKTGASADTLYIVSFGHYLMYRPILPTGNTNPALYD